MLKKLILKNMWLKDCFVFSNYSLVKKIAKALLYYWSFEGYLYTTIIAVNKERNYKNFITCSASQLEYDVPFFNFLIKGFRFCNLII